MKTFTFDFFGETAEFTANTPLHAYVMANRKFNPSNGAWFPIGDAGFSWVTGNFFD